MGREACSIFYRSLKDISSIHETTVNLPAVKLSRTRNYTELQPVNQVIHASGDINTTSILETYLKNCDHEPCCGMTRSDLFYIPSRLKNKFMLLSTIAFDQRFFLETAVPTILISLDTVDNIIPLYGEYLVGENYLTKFHNYYTFEKTFIHPIKLNLELEHGQLSIKLVRDYIMKYSKVLLR